MDVKPSSPALPATAAAATSAAKPGATPKMVKTAQDFEAVFLGQMTQLMLEGVDTDPNFGGGHGEEMFKGVLAEKLGTELAKRGGIGLAPTVLDQMIKMQGQAQ